MAAKKRTVSRSPRRPLASRGQRWAKAFAGILLRAGLSPNAISVGGLLFAGAGAWLLYQSRALSAVQLVAAAACIQLRLLCNLMDGMVAIEGGRKSANGEIYNEVPDRVADLLLLVAAGYALPWAWGGALGWAAACAALLTAYLRLFGGSLGLPQDFRGPQAKPQRMALLTLACLAAAAGSRAGASTQILAGGLGLVLAGTLATFLRRLWSLNRALRTA